MRLTLAAALAAALTVAACGSPSGSSGDMASAPPPAPGPTDEQAQAMLASLPAPYSTADWANGKKQFARCRSCHTLTEGGPDIVGPNLHGVLGRPMGSKPGYNYSDALKAAGHHPWDPGHLDAWIENPRAAHPGTKMSFAGLSDAKDRQDLIAYLMTETGYTPEAATAEAPAAEHHH
jgi:cytochrome c